MDETIEIETEIEVVEMVETEMVEIEMVTGAEAVVAALTVTVGLGAGVPDAVDTNLLYS